MRLCDKCIALFQDAGFVVTPEPLAYGEYTYKKCENCKNSRYANKVRVIAKKNNKDWSNNESIQSLF